MDRGSLFHRLAVWLGLREDAAAGGPSPAAETTSGEQECRRCGICHHVCTMIPRTPKGPRPGPEE